VPDEGGNQNRSEAIGEVNRGKQRSSEAI
jgi:hypothetical protein